MNNQSTGLAAPTAREQISQGLLSQLAELVRLSAPMIVARGGIILMTTIDIVMVANYAIRDVAYQAIALSVVMPMIVIGMGLLMGTLVLTANKVGAGELSECGSTWRRSIAYAGVLGAFGLIITQFGEPILLALGQSAELAAHGGHVMSVAGFSLPALFIFITTQFFLEGIERPAPVMLAMISANLLNVGLNALLIFGNWGAPEMGAVGAAWATTIARTVAAVALVAHVWFMAEHAKYGVRTKARVDQKAWRVQRRVGYAASLGIGGESIAFAILHVFAGWMGATELAAFSLTFNILTIVFMLALGLGAGTSVRVGISLGRGNIVALRNAGWTGLGANTIAMVAIALVFATASEQVVALFTDETTLIAVSATLISFAAYLLVVDGGQAVMANALRGRRDVWLPCVLQLVAFLGVMVPVAYWLGIARDLGPIGLLSGMLIGCGFAFASLTWRFHHLSVEDGSRSASAPTRGLEFG